jgi:hypothetical protein
MNSKGKILSPWSEGENTMANDTKQFVCFLRMQRICTYLALLTICVSSIAAENGPCGGEKNQEYLSKALLQKGMLVLKAIEQRNEAVFIRHVSRRGMGFGVDVPFTSVDKIRAQLRQKQGVYCLLFSTPCIAMTNFTKDTRADSVLSEWKISYAEWLSLNTPYSAEVELGDDASEMCGGVVTVRGRAKLKSAPSVLELLFSYENGIWVLVNTPDQAGD